MDGILKLSYQYLSEITDNFSESNYIGHFQCGKLYHAKRYWLGRTLPYVLKMWEIPESYNYFPRDTKLRLMNEIILLRHEMLISHPGMVKLYGFCADGEHFGVLYELQAVESVFSLIPKDGFTWLQRVKVALGVASLLKFLQAAGNSLGRPFVLRNLDSSHLLLDENGYPRLCDFGKITGGIFPDRIICKDCHALGCYGYFDKSAGEKGNCSDKQDVFAYGVILLGLITKRVYTEEDRQAQVPYLHEWAHREHEARETDGDTKTLGRSLVHESFKIDPDFISVDGGEITATAMECLNVCDYKRPTMKQLASDGGGGGRFSCCHIIGANDGACLPALKFFCYGEFSIARKAESSISSIDAGEVLWSFAIFVTDVPVPRRQNAQFPPLMVVKSCGVLQYEREIEFGRF